MSLSRNRQTKMIVKQMRKAEKKLPAIPSTAEIASGTDAEILLGSRLHVPGRPAVAEPGQLVRCAQLLDDRRQLLEEVSDTADERHEEQQSDHEHPDGGAEHRDGRGEPARQPVFAITKRTGYSNTSARKIPTNTNRNVSPIAQNAASTPAVAATSNTVRIGRTSSTRRGVWSGRRLVAALCSCLQAPLDSPGVLNYSGRGAAALHADGMKLQASPTRGGWSRRLRSVRASRRAAGIARRADGVVPLSGLRSPKHSAKRATKVLVIAAVITVRKPIPNSITKAATSRPATSSGTLSPYPTVVVVWTAHQSPEPIDGYLLVFGDRHQEAGPDGDDDRGWRSRRRRHAVWWRAPPRRRVGVRASSRLATGVGLDWSRYPASLVAHSNVWIAKATANPSVVTIPASLPPCSNASGIIVSASMVRIAPAAKASTKATVSCEVSWNST